MAILSKACKPDNFESHNLLKCVLLVSEAFVLILLDGNLFLNQTLLTFLLYETSIDVSVGSGNFSVRHYLPWLCSLYEWGTSFCMGIISRKFCQFLFMFLTGFTLFSLLLFPLSITIFISVHSFCCCFIWHK